MNKLKKVFTEWLESHQNIRGTGRYSLVYKRSKLKKGLNPNFGKLFVSNRGRIFRRVSKNSLFWEELPYHIEVDARDNRTPHANIRIKYKSKMISLSRLVAMVWVYNPNPSLYNIVMHLDNDKFNNNFLNLKWGTQSHNICQARDEGRLPTLFVSGPLNPSFGKRNSPLSISDEKLIVKEVLSGKLTKTQIAKNFGISRSCINPIMRRNGYGK